MFELQYSKNFAVLLFKKPVLMAKKIKFQQNFHLYKLFLKRILEREQCLIHIGNGLQETGNVLKPIEQ